MSGGQTSGRKLPQGTSSLTEGYPANSLQLFVYCLFALHARCWYVPNPPDNANMANLTSMEGLAAQSRIATRTGTVLSPKDASQLESLDHSKLA